MSTETTKSIPAEPGTITAAAGKAAAFVEKRMDERRRANFWTGANLRITVINAIIVAVIGVVSVYTANLLSQQALANRIDNLEAISAEKAKNRDAQIQKIDDKLDNKVVTNDVLELQLRPIKDALKDQKDTLDQIRAATVRNAPANYSPNVRVDPPP